MPNLEVQYEHGASGSYISYIAAGMGSDRQEEVRTFLLCFILFYFQPGVLSKYLPDGLTDKRELLLRLIGTSIDLFRQLV